MTADALIESGDFQLYTSEDYDRDMARVVDGFAAVGVAATAIELLVRTHDYRHDGGAIDELAESWISLRNIAPYVNR